MLCLTNNVKIMESIRVRKGFVTDYRFKDQHFSLLLISARSSCETSSEINSISQQDACYGVHYACRNENGHKARQGCN